MKVRNKQTGETFEAYKEVTYIKTGTNEGYFENVIEVLDEPEKKKKDTYSRVLDTINTIAFIAFGGVVCWFLYQMLPMLVDFN